jgi:hypothetical protein
MTDGPMNDSPLDRLRAALDDSIQPEAAYRAHSGLNWSLLKTIGKSPKHFLHSRNNPRPDSPTFRIGRAVHAAILEPERFEQDWIVYAGRRAGKAWAAFFEEHSDREILNQSEMDKVRAMAAAVRGRSDLAAVLAEGIAEASYVWSHGITYHPKLNPTFKARADWIYHDGEGFVLLDLKTTRDIESRSFGRDAARLLYHGQLAHYRDGLAQILMDAGIDESLRVELLVVETEAPHDCGIYRLDSTASERGAMRRDDLLQRWAECTTSGDWPGQLPEPGWLELPEWELRQLDELEA